MGKTAMTANPDLLERSGDLKRELLDYMSQRRFDRPVRRALEQRFGRTPVVDEEELANFLDWFVLQERLSDGRTVVETFVAEHPELPEAERAMLLGWRDVVEGIFEVERRDAEALVVVNLIDDLTYRVRSNMGPAVFRQMPRRSFLVGRLVPIGDEWLLSGMTSVLPAASRADVYRMGTELSTRFPALVFRNPEKLARGWELQREERRHFIDFFGADLVVLPGREVDARMRAYHHYRTYEARDTEGKTVAERAEAVHGKPPPEIEVAMPADFTDAETVGVIYDEEQGLGFFIDFGVVEEIFANPALAADRRHRQAVLSYLQDESVSPLPFRRLGERDPERASEVFRRVLKQPRFSWERDSEALLQRYKASFFEQPLLPSVMPVSERLARAAMTAAANDRPQPDYRPARRRKQGSWRTGGRPW
jgi:hypothetical protein